MHAKALAKVLRDGGLDVVEVPGWQKRGVPGMRFRKPRGGLAHHTGTPDSVPGDYPTLGTVTNGRADLQGPLAQLGLGRSGRWYLIAAGYANHAGPVDDPSYSNLYALAVEGEHPGGSASWPPRQYRSYVLGCALIGDKYHIVWRGHKEAAVPYGRKPDPNFNMTRFRADVAAIQKELIKLPLTLTRPEMRLMIRKQSRRGLLTKKGTLRKDVRQAIAAAVAEEIAKQGAKK